VLRINALGHQLFLIPGQHLELQVRRIGRSDGTSPIAISWLCLALGWMAKDLPSKSGPVFISNVRQIEGINCGE
jgi:hypothetical protein